jgi:hypothetical protein
LSTSAFMAHIQPSSYGTTLVKSQYSIIFVFFYILLMTLQGAGCFDDESV